MTIKQLAAQIPAEYRREILLTNMIATAVPNMQDKAMHYLFTIWKNYINPEEKGDCILCFKRVLDNYKAMQETLIELERESNLLKNA